MAACDIPSTAVIVVRMLALAALLCVLVGCSRDAASAGDRQAAIDAATAVYAQQRAAGVDFSAGPCLADVVIADWSADIAHSPREEVDNQPENQCRAYRDGETHHFVELTPDGALIRAK